MSPRDWTCFQLGWATLQWTINSTFGPSKSQGSSLNTIGEKGEAIAERNLKIPQKYGNRNNGEKKGQ